MNLSRAFHQGATLILFVTTLFLAASCDSTTGQLNEDEQTLQLEGTWAGEGLSGRQINSLHAADGFVYATTDTGVFRKPAGAAGRPWTHLGLDVDSAEAVDLVTWNEQELMAAIKYDDFRTTKPTLFESLDGGNSWSPIDVHQPDRSKYFVVVYLELDPENPDKLFAYTGNIQHSTDRGRTWRPIYDGAGFSKFLTVDRHHPDHIWTGGYTNIFSPYIAGSTDGGDSWTQFNVEISTGSDATVTDAIVNPASGQGILAAMGGRRRSADGGQTWNTLTSGNFASSVFAHSARRRGLIYSSGLNPEQTVFFVATQTFGTTWEVETYRESPIDIEVDHMTTIMAGGTEVIYLGTNKGVFSFTFEN